jgi:hypothetical protein
VFDQAGVIDGYGPIDPRVADNYTTTQPQQVQPDPLARHAHALPCCMCLSLPFLMSPDSSVHCWALGLLRHVGNGIQQGADTSVHQLIETTLMPAQMHVGVC